MKAVKILSITGIALTVVAGESVEGARVATNTFDGAASTESTATKAWAPDPGDTSGLSLGSVFTVSPGAFRAVAAVDGGANLSPATSSASPITVSFPLTTGANGVGLSSFNFRFYSTTAQAGNQATLDRVVTFKLDIISSATSASIFSAPLSIAATDFVAGNSGNPYAQVNFDLSSGAELPAGSTYTVTLTATGPGYVTLDNFEVSAATGPALYWDANGATAGAGGSAPGGNWNDAVWSTDAQGGLVTTPWLTGARAVFAAGSDATDPYTVTLAGTQSANSVKVEEGRVTLSGGTLQLLVDGLLNANATSSLEVASALSAGDLTSAGDVLLSGPATVSGTLTVAADTLRLAAPVTAGGLAGGGTLDLGASVLTAGGTTNTTYTGTLLGGASGSFVKQGSGTLALGGNGVSSFSGPLTIAAGTLETGAAVGNGLTSYLGAVTADRTVKVNAAATLRFLRNNVFGGGGKSAATIPAILLDGGTLQTTRFNIVGHTTLRDGASLTNSSTDTGTGYGGYQFLGDVTVEGSGSTASLIQNNGSTRQNHLLGGAATTFAVGDVTNSAAADLIVSSALGDGSGDYPGVAGLVKTGAGTLSLTGANSFTGDTTVTGGILAVSGGSLADGGKLVIDGGKVAATGTEVVRTLYFGAVQQAAGTWGATNSGAENIDDVHFAGTAGVVSVTLGQGVPYDQWIANYPGVGVLTAFNDDADHDGLPNGIEQVLGSDPSVANTDFTLVSASASSIIFHHTRTNEAPADVRAAYQWSTDLVNWFASGTADGGTTVTLVPTTLVDTSAPAVDTIEVKATITGTPTPRIFCRLKATR